MPSLFVNSCVEWWLYLQSLIEHSGFLSLSLLCIREAWLGWRWWWGQSLGAAPDPGMEFHLVVKGSSSGHPASLSVACTVPLPARCTAVSEVQEFSAKFPCTMAALCGVDAAASGGCVCGRSLYWKITQKQRCLSTLAVRV